MNKKFYIALEIGSDEGLLHCELCDDPKVAKKTVRDWYQERRKEIKDNGVTIWSAITNQYLETSRNHYEFKIVEKIHDIF